MEYTILYMRYWLNVMNSYIYRNLNLNLEFLFRFMEMSSLEKHHWNQILSICVLNFRIYWIYLSSSFESIVLFFKFCWLLVAFITHTQCIGYIFECFFSIYLLFLLIDFAHAIHFTEFGWIDCRIIFSTISKYLLMETWERFCLR